MAKLLETSGARMAIRRIMRRPGYRYMVVNRIVPHIPWMILFALAVYLYKARIFADSGFYVSQFINNQTFWIECQRYVLAISQLIPLIGVWSGLGMKYVLLLYSLSHVIFFYILFLFVYYGLRDRRSGLLIIIFQTVGIIYSFYTPMFELYYGAPLLIVFYSIWQLPFRFKSIYVLLILEFFILLSHPLAFMLFVFLMLYDFRREKAKPLKYYAAIALVFAGCVAFKYFIMCDYESGKLAWQFNYTDNKQYLQMINPAYYLVLAKYMLRYYPEVLAGLVLVTGMLVKRRQWYRLILVLGTFAAYTFLVNSAYTVSQSRYMEQVMFPFIPIVFIPLIYGFSARGRHGLQNISVLLVSAMIACRLFVIYDGSEIFRLRVQQMEQLIQAARQKGGSKFVVRAEAVDHGYTQLNWSFPIETMLLSAIDGNDIVVTIVPEDDLYFEGNNNKIAPDEFIFRKWELKKQSWLNSRYFHLDIGPYRSLNDSTPNQNLPDVAENLRIRINSRNFYKAADTVWIPVTISNSGTQPLYTGGGNKLSLSYFWVKDNNVLNWDGIRTPVQADIRSSLTQNLKVAIPAERGKMQLKIDLIGNDQWMGIHCQDDVFVY
jgi:hypothetical protein